MPKQKQKSEAGTSLKVLIKQVDGLLCQTTDPRRISEAKEQTEIHARKREMNWDLNYDH